MPEILTESFCERCGTRYTFESAAPTKVRKLGRFKTISKGLKNYVMSDDSSLDEAMAAARSDDELEQTAQQLDAFHSTFNFCMNCRQYTCANCWNEGESRCLTCAPHLGHEIMPAPFPEMPTPVAEAPPEAWPVADIAPVAAAAALTDDAELEEIDLASRLDRLSATSDDSVPSWLAEAEAAALASAEAQAAQEAADETYIAAELPFEEPAVADVAAIAAEEPEQAPVGLAAAAAGTVAMDDPVAETIVVEAEPVAPAAEADATPVDVPVEAAPEPVAAAAEAEAAPVELPVEVAPETVAATAATEAAIDADEPDDQAAVAARQTSALLAKFRPGQSIDAELEAYEAAVAANAVSDIVDEAPVETVAEAEPEHHTVAASAAMAAAVNEPDTAAQEPVAAPEPVAAEVEPAQVEPEPVAAEPELVAAEPEPVAAAAEVEPVAAEPELVAAVAAEVESADIEPQPVAPEPEPIAATTEAEPVAALAQDEPVRTDVVEQPTWQIVAPEAPLTNGHAPEEPVVAPPATPPVPSAPPEWPTTPQWPQANVTHLSQQPPPQSAAMDALWAASVRDVVAPTQDGPLGTVQPCNSCGLSLSANARFCRRCGTRQGA